jgi:hypothetical protein
VYRLQQTHVSAHIWHDPSYETAELVATEALYTSPSLLKARFRRGLARKAIGTVEKLKLAMEGMAQAGCLLSS